MMASERRKFSSRACPVNDFLLLVQVRGWTLREADEVVFNLERKSTRIRSHFQGADQHLIQAVFLSNIWGDPKPSIDSFQVSRIIKAVVEKANFQIQLCNGDRKGDLVQPGTL